MTFLDLGEMLRLFLIITQPSGRWGIVKLEHLQAATTVRLNGARRNVAHHVLLSVLPPLQSQSQQASLWAIRETKGRGRRGMCYR